MHAVSRLALSATLLLASAAALAQESDPRCSPELPQACLNGVSSTVTGYDSLRVAANRTAPRRLEDEEDPAGGNALVQRWVARATGDSAYGPDFGAWISYAYSDFASTVAIAPYEADLHSVLVGYDWLLGNSGTVGVAIMVERRESDTFYNGGGEETDGVGFSFYGVHPFSDIAYLDWAVGYSSLETEQERVDPQGSITPVTAQFDSERWFAALNGSSTQVFWDTLVLTARAGVLYAVESADGYTEQGGPSARPVGSKRMHVVQGSLGGELAYNLQAIEPYTFVGYRRDFDRNDGAEAGGLPAGIETQPDDRDEGEAGIGMRYFARSFSASLEWLHTFARERFENDTVSLLVRAEF